MECLAASVTVLNILMMRNRSVYSLVFLTFLVWIPFINQNYLKKTFFWIFEDSSWVLKLKKVEAEWDSLSLAQMESSHMDAIEERLWWEYRVHAVIQCPLTLTIGIFYFFLHVHAIHKTHSWEFRFDKVKRGDDVVVHVQSLYFLKVSTLASSTYSLFAYEPELFGDIPKLRNLTHHSLVCSSRSQHIG